MSGLTSFFLAKTEQSVWSAASAEPSFALSVVRIDNLVAPDASDISTQQGMIDTESNV